MPAEDIVATFAATLLGIVLGIPIAFWIDRKRKEQKQRESAVAVLTALKEEINRDINLLKQIQNELKPDTIIYYNLDINTWRATSLQEFEDIISNDLLRDICRIYYEYEHLNRKIDMQFSMHYSAVRVTEIYPAERTRIVASILEHVAKCEKESEELIGKINVQLLQLSGLPIPITHPKTITQPKTDDSKNMGKRREHLDSLFQVALVLLGILAAAELQYATAFPLPTDLTALQGVLNLREFTFRITTIPFVILILTWMIKEIVVKARKNRRLEMVITLFCWDFWSFSLYIFLAILYTFSVRGGLKDAYNYIFASWLLSLLMVVGVAWAYSKIRSEPDSQEFGRTKWYKWGALLASIIATIVLIVVAVLSLLSFGQIS